MNRFVRILFLCLFLVQPFAVEAGDNPFVSKESSEKGVKLPTFGSKIFAKIMLWQHEFNTKLTEHVKQLQADRSWAQLFPLILISFLYGVIHAAGPGHGKVVVFSYFLSRRSSIKRGILLGNLISLFHAVSGIVIVLILYYVIKTAYIASFESISQKIKMMSYSLVVVIGLFLLFTAVRNIRKPPSQAPERGGPANAKDRRGVLPLALAVGMVPCPGVVIIMLFAMSFHLLAVGLVMSLIMAAGMAATISLAGLLSILGQEGLLKGFAKRERVQHQVQKTFAIFGSLLIIAFGSVLLAGGL